MCSIYKTSATLLDLEEYKFLLNNPDRKFLIKNVNIPQSNSIYLIQHDNFSTIRKPITSLSFEEDSRYSYAGKFKGLARTTFNLKYKERENSETIETDDFKMINFHLLNSKDNISVVHFLGNIENFSNYFKYKIKTSSKNIINKIRSTIKCNPEMPNSHIYLKHKSEAKVCDINKDKNDKQLSSSPSNLSNILEDSFNSSFQLNSDSKCSSELNLADQPRNKNQIKMIRKKMVKETKVFADGILNSWLFDKIGPELIQEFKIIPSLEVNLVHKGALELATRLMNKSKFSMQLNLPIEILIKN